MKNLKESNAYKHCNHHHELTEDHEVIQIDGLDVVTNKEATVLIQELNKVGLRTRTHHVDKNGGFIGILMDNVEIEVVKVNEGHSTRDIYNGKTELLISWKRKTLNPECEVCENCGNTIQLEHVVNDKEGVTLCQDCFDVLKYCPDFYEDGVLPAELREQSK